MTASRVLMMLGRDGCSSVVFLNPVPGATWISGYLRRADENRDGKMSYDEVKRLLQMINIDLNEQYARSLFKVSVSKDGGERCGDMAGLAG